MYLYRDTKHDIPNTFDSVSANKFFSVKILIWNLTQGYVKREDIPADVLKRVDAEIQFIMETQVKPTNHFLEKR